MSKKNYTALRLDDLTGGINTRDYPSEIEDKQSLSLLNWNFEGNQLVTSKGFEQKLDTGGDKIGGITLDGKDIWHISDGTLYKNGAEQQENGGVFISVKEIPSYWVQFMPWLKFYITIDGVEYIITGSNSLSLKNNLISQLTATGLYQINSTSDGFFLSSDTTSITVSVTKKSSLLINAFLSTSTFDNHIGVQGSINGMFFRLSSDIVGSRSMRDWYYLLHNGSLSTYLTSKGISNNLFYLKRNVAGTTITFDISNGTSFDSVGTLVNGVNSAEFSAGTATMLGANTTNVTSCSIILEGTTYSSTGTDISSTLNNLITVLSAAGYRANRYYNSNGGASWGQDGILIYKESNPSLVAQFSDWSALSSGTQVKNGLPINYNGPQNPDSWTIQNQINITTLSTGSAFGGIVDINVTPYGQLVIDRDEGGASLYKDNLYIPIGVDSVGTPKAGIIYKGKIVLGGYGNDNIVFSQTSTPTQPLAFLNFSTYSAGGQSVSAGNKGNITGFKVGENGLYVFKENEVWSSSSEFDDKDGATPSFNFIFNKVTSTGALNQSVITDVQQDTFYLDWKNRSVRRLSYEANVSSLRDSRVNDEIRELFMSLPEEQPLATASFAYPNYKLSLTDNSGGTITYPNGKTYYLNTINFVYNVDKKSWTIEYNGKKYLRSNSGYFCDSLGFIYKDDIGNIKEDGTHISKEYTFGDDVSYKRYGLIEVTGDIKSDGIGKTKELEIEVLVDDENAEIGDSDINPNKRKIISEDGELVRFKESIELFDDGQTFKFKFSHNGEGYIKISDVNILYRPTKIKPEYF